MITRGTVHGRIGRVKTEYSEDEMPLDPAFARIIQKWQMQCPASEGNGSFRIPTRAGCGTPLFYREISLCLRARRSAYCGWAGIPFRHSYRSLLDACGAPIGVQQKLVRHAQVSTT